MSNQTINIDGVEHNVADLPQSVQNLINIHAKWTAETEEARLTLAKNEAAVREVSREIIAAISSLTAPAEPAVPVNNGRKSKKEKAAA